MTRTATSPATTLKHATTDSEQITPVTARAFSLIELMAVLAILAVAMGMTVWVWSGRTKAARLQDVVEQLGYLDRMARQTARGDGTPVALRFDLDVPSVRRVQDAERSGVAYQLPDGFAIERVTVEGMASKSRQVDIGVSGQGLSPSYAVSVKGPQGQGTWYVVAGLSGHQVVLETEAQAKSVLSQTRTRGGGFDD